MAEICCQYGVSEQTVYRWRNKYGGLDAFAIYDMPSQPVWHQGPVVLIGDAVHAISPSSGQGASLAMEDAAMLAKWLRAAPDVATAFAQYEQARRTRVERMVTWARSLGSAKLISNPIAVWLRDLLMPFFLKRAANPAALDWIYAYQVEWEPPRTKTGVSGCVGRRIGPLRAREAAIQGRRFYKSHDLRHSSRVMLPPRADDTARGSVGPTSHAPS